MGALVKALVLYKADEPGSAGDEDLAPSGKRLRLDVAVARTTGRTPRPDQLGPRPGQPAQPGTTVLRSPRWLARNQPYEPRPSLLHPRPDATQHGHASADGTSSIWRSCTSGAL